MKLLYQSSRSIVWVFIVTGIYAIASFYAVQLAQCVDSLLTRFNIINDKLNTRYEIKDSCNVCSKNTCKRHKLLPHSTKVKVPKDFDHALEQVINHYTFCAQLIFANSILHLLARDMNVLSCSFWRRYYKFMSAHGTRIFQQTKLSYNNYV